MNLLQRTTIQVTFINRTVGSRKSVRILAESELPRRIPVDEHGSVDRKCPSRSGIRVIDVRVIEGYLYRTFHTTRVQAADFALLKRRGIVQISDMHICAYSAHLISGLPSTINVYRLGPALSEIRR